MKFFEDRFYIGDLIVQDKFQSDLCNPEVDSMFLTSNTLFLSDTPETKDQLYSYISPEFKLRRFPTQGMRGALAPYNVPNSVSRDNAMGYFCLLSRRPKLARTFAWDIIKRGSFFPNTKTTQGKDKLLPDFCGPEHWATIIRSLGFGWIVYPLVVFLDIFYLLRILIALTSAPEKASTEYHLLSSLKLSWDIMPTPFSMLAIWVYTKFRKHVPGYEAKSGIISALKYYSRKSFDPPIYEVAEKFLVGYNKKWGWLWKLK